MYLRRAGTNCGSVQWVFAASFIALGHRNGALFKPGEHFYSADVLPDGATFDPAVHGHWSRQVGIDPLMTLFVRD